MFRKTMVRGSMLAALRMWAGVLILLSSVATSVHSQTLTTLACFNGTNGAYPNTSLTLSGNTLYGTTFLGGASWSIDQGYGTVFSVPVGGGSPTVLASFNSVTREYPAPGLTLCGNTLYGTTEFGGAYYGGTVFSVPVSGGTPTVLVSFNDSTGVNPCDSLTLSGNTLYGTTSNDGPNGGGTVFSVPVGGGTPTVLASFVTSVLGNSTGCYPQAGVTLCGDTLYGTTNVGGNWSLNHGLGYGSVFSLPITGGTPTPLASLINSSNPGPTYSAGLTVVGNTLYGTTEFGGPNNDGTVFSVPVSGGSLTVLTSFDGSDGQWPCAGLTPRGNTLYGTTLAGGPNGAGTVFSIPVSGGTPTVLASFSNGVDGAFPRGGLTLSGNTLYGTTSQGGNQYTGGECGTVFALNLVLSAWNNSGSGSWNTPGNWTSGTSPNGVGLQVVLGSSATTSSTVTLDGSQTVGSLTFSNSVASYTLAAGSGGTLTLNNSSGSANSQLLVLAGSHTISAPVTIAGGSLTVSESNNSSLLISGNINDDNNCESLTLNGDGTGRLVLSGTNTYGGGSIVEAGTLEINTPNALPAGGSLTIGAGGTFIFDPMASAAPVASPGASVSAVPEPSALALFTVSAVAVSIYIRRRHGTNRFERHEYVLYRWGLIMKAFSSCRRTPRRSTTPAACFLRRNPQLMFCPGRFSEARFSSLE